MKIYWILIILLLLAGCSTEEKLIGDDLPDPVDTPLVINEFLASNDMTVTDPAGEYDDWIEIYNNSDESLNLAGMYLTDDAGEPLKWQFPVDNPQETSIPSHGYLLIWCDEDENQPGLHASFKLSASGEDIVLSAPSGAEIDSYTFGSQEQDISEGRLPDAGDNWQFFTEPTPGSSNQ